MRGLVHHIDLTVRDPKASFPFYDTLRAVGYEFEREDERGFLRNDRMLIAVAPLSLRRRPGAPVSMPINWNQVKAGLNPMRYTVRTVPALLSKSKAWEDYCDAERPLEAAIGKLVAGK
jgi:hypothetical protein